PARRQGGVASGLLCGGAVNQRFGETTREFGLPPEPPVFPEGAAAPSCAQWCAPGHMDEREAMQQQRLGEARLAPQIERNVGIERLGLEFELALPTREVGGQRHLRHALVDLTNALADNKLLLDQAERCRLAFAERGETRLAHLFEARQREVPQ